MAERIAMILNGHSYPFMGTEMMVERYQRLMLVLRCDVPEADVQAINSEMDVLFDQLVGQVS